jgi:predicted transcriptional regulator
MTRTISVRLDDVLAARLDRLAAALDRPETWLIEQAVARYVEQEAWELEAIAEALTEYRQGQGTPQPHDEVSARIQAKIREQYGRTQ